MCLADDICTRLACGCVERRPRDRRRGGRASRCRPRGDCTVRRTQVEPAVTVCRWQPAPASYTSLTSPCVRFAAAECREVDRRHHHHRGRGGDHRLGGRRRHSRRCDAPRALPRAAVDRCEAAWSCKAAAEAAVAAKQRGGSHRAAQARCPRVFGGSGGAEKVAYRGQLPDAVCEKNCVFRCVFLALCVALWARRVCF